MDPVRLGVVGIFGMGQGHVRNAMGLEEVELTAVCDINAERVSEAAGSLGVAGFSDYDEFLTSDLFEAVLVATPHYFHADQSCSALDKGLHVLCEKPLAVRVSETDRMVQAAEASGKLLATMLQQRTEPIMRKAHEIVASGGIGRVVRATTIEACFRSDTYYAQGGWRATWGGEGGGVLLNQAPHPLDLFIWIAGHPCRVYGRARTVSHDIEVEDEASAIFEYSDGGTGYFYSSTAEGPRRRPIFEVSGTAGTISMTNGRLDYSTYDVPSDEIVHMTPEVWGQPQAGKVDVELPEQTGVKSHARITQNFALAIRGEEELIAPGSDGMRSLEAANAILLSSALGRPVDLPLDRDAYDRFFKERESSSSFRLQEE